MFDLYYNITLWFWHSLHSQATSPFGFMSWQVMSVHSKDGMLMERSFSQTCPSIFCVLNVIEDSSMAYWANDGDNKKAKVRLISRSK